MYRHLTTLAPRRPSRRFVWLLALVALAATAAPATAAGDTNLVANPSFDTSLAGWGSYQATLARTALAGAPDGAYVVKATRGTGNVFSVSDEKGGAQTILSTSGGEWYVATAYVRAASASSVGKPVQIFLREQTQTGGAVKDTPSPAVKLGTSWRRIGVETQAGAGHTLGVRVVQSSAVAGDAFYADLVTLRTEGTVAGYSSEDPFSAPADGGPRLYDPVWTSMSVNAKRASWFSTQFVTTTVDVGHLRAWIDGRGATSGSERVRGVIYADAAGRPGTLIARTNEVVVSAGRPAGWTVLRFPSPVRIAAGRYWLGLHSGGTAPVARYGALACACDFFSNADAYSDGASSTFGAANTDEKNMFMAAEGG